MPYEVIHDTVCFVRKAIIASRERVWRYSIVFTHEWHVDRCAL